MKRQVFRPEEVLFSPSMQCNLSCPHCDITQDRLSLSAKDAVRFLNACADAGIKRVGFTGGEPFLKLHFLSAVIKAAALRNMYFGSIMTNGAWFKSYKEMKSALQKLFNAGYDGNICVSVDAFHQQNLRKAALFIRYAVKIWKRPDIISIASVKDARDKATSLRLSNLSCLLKARFIRRLSKYSFIQNREIFLKIFYIELAPIGKAAQIKQPWDGKWFKDDFCKGPGNVFFVLPDAAVKPCCGYAYNAEILALGSINSDTPHRLIQNARKNRFISAIFGLGLHYVRKRLELSGVRFPGKTTNHCFFCHYIMNYVPRSILEKCLSV